MSFRKSRFTFKLVIDGSDHDIDEPRGFKDINSRLFRDMENHGCFFEYTPDSVELGFSGIAYDLLDNAFDENGVDANEHVIFEIINSDGNITYSGSVDFSNIKKDFGYFNCSIIRSDILTDLVNNRDKKVDLLSGQTIGGNWAYPAEPQTISLHSFVLEKLFSVKYANNTGSYEFEQTTDSEYSYLLIKFSTDDVTKDEFNEIVDGSMVISTDPFYDDYRDQFWENLTSKGSLIFSGTSDLDIYFYIRNDDAGTINFTRHIYLIIKQFNNIGVLQDTFTKTVLTDSVSLDPAQEDTYTGNIVGSFGPHTFTPHRGDYFTAYIEFYTEGWTGNTPVSVKIDINSLILNGKLESIENASQATGMLLGDAMEACLRIITEEPAPMLSNFFDVGGCGHYSFITNGLNIREFDRPIAASFNDLFKSAQAIFGLGYGMDSGQIRIELWEHFYQDVLLCDLGTVSDVEITVAGDLIFNEIQLGWSKYADNEELQNSLEDFHTESVWSTPIKNHKGVLEKKSDIICSTFMIESVRRQQFSHKSTESTKWDDNLFLIACVPGTGSQDYDAETNQNFDTVTGLTNPDTAYNLRFSIKRMLLNWGVWINSFTMRYKGSSEKIRNTFFKNNGDLATQFSASESCLMGDIDRAKLKEKDDIEKQNIQDSEQLFDQKLIKFKTTLSNEDLETIKNGCLGELEDYPGKNFGYIKISWQNEQLTGWLIDLDYNIYTQMAEITLLQRYYNLGTIDKRLLEDSDKRLLEDSEFRLLE